MRVQFTDAAPAIRIFPLPQHPGAPGKTRTSDLRFRKPSLYPLSYGGAAGRLLKDRASFDTSAMPPHPDPIREIRSRFGRPRSAGIDSRRKRGNGRGLWSHQACVVDLEPRAKPFDRGPMVVLIGTIRVRVQGVVGLLARQTGGGQQVVGESPRKGAAQREAGCAPAVPPRGPRASPRQKRSRARPRSCGRCRNRRGRSPRAGRGGRAPDPRAAANDPR